MMGFLRWITGTLAALYVIIFAISNRTLVPFHLLPFTPAQLYPLYWIGLWAIGVGFITGAVTVWLNLSPLRAMKKEQTRRIKQLEKQLETANEHKKMNENGTALPLISQEKL